MIFNHHLLLEETFDKMSVYFDGTCWKVHFYEADLFELNKILLSAERKYPLIWLQTGYTKKERIQGGRFELNNLSLFIITKGDKTDRYKKRFDTTFKLIIYPILNKLLAKIKSESGISFGSENYTTTDVPFNDVSALPDIWDALILDIDLTVNPDCYPKYFINN